MKQSPTHQSRARTAKGRLCVPHLMTRSERAKTRDLLEDVVIRLACQSQADSVQAASDAVDQAVRKAKRARRFLDDQWFISSVNDSAHPQS